MEIHPFYNLVGSFPLPWTCLFIVIVVVLFGGTQHSPVNDHSAESCNFGSLTGKDEFTPFYFAILTYSWAQTGKGQNVYIPPLKFLHLSALSDRLEAHGQSEGHLLSSRICLFTMKNPTLSCHLSHMMILFVTCKERMCFLMGWPKAALSQSLPLILKTSPVQYLIFLFLLLPVSTLFWRTFTSSQT